MDDVTNVWFGPLPESSSYIKPYRMYFHQDSVAKDFDFVKVEDTVQIIIYNKETNELVLVKQFRPVAYYDAIRVLGYSHGDKIDMIKYPAKLGIMLELCGGTVDNELSLKEIAQEEILEECGFEVPLDRIEEVMIYKSGLSLSGASETMYYCEVTNYDKVSSGGGVGDEIIEVVEISLQNSQIMVKQNANNMSPPSCLLGILWFLYNKAPTANNSN